MTFEIYFFEDFNENIDGIVYFLENSNLKPSGMGTIRLKVSGLLDFVLQNVLYLPEMKRSLLSLFLIQQQGHSIHMMSGKFEV
jgi:hypothetical protein